MVNHGPRKYCNNEKITRTEFSFRLAVSSVTFETELQLLPWRNSNETPSGVATPGHALAQVQATTVLGQGN